MKKIIYISILIIVNQLAKGQVAFGGKLSVEGNSTIVDFNNTIGNTSGIILPAVENVNNSLASNASDNNGTFLFDKNTGKIRMFENNFWIDLSSTGNSAAISTNNSAESANSQGVIIGSDISNAKGVLVLESSDKAMILPRISNPHLTVKSPYPGMICYDTTSKTLAMFDGSVWNYWK